MANQGAKGGMPQQPSDISKQTPQQQQQQAGKTREAEAKTGQDAEKLAQEGYKNRQNPDRS